MPNEMVQTAVCPHQIWRPDMGGMKKKGPARRAPKKSRLNGPRMRRMQRPVRRGQLPILPCETEYDLDTGNADM